MKKLILILTIALMPLFGNAQSILSELEDNDNVTTIIINQKMFEMMGKIHVEDEEGKEMVELIKGLDQLKIFTTENQEMAELMKNAVESHLNDSNLSELLRINDKEVKVKIYIKEGKNDTHVTELLMFVEGIKNQGERQPEVVILSITGDIDLDKISDLVNQMNISGAEHLKTKN